jgi:N-acetylglucosamine-6-phosphate deacetylase
MFGDNRVILISDAMRATGMADGTYELGGQTVYKKGHFATLLRALEWRKPSAA